VSDITTCQFFPSGQVILSSASDMMLKIWGLDGSNPVTLKGHRAGILDTKIVGKGRNIISSSRDGTVKLWECGSSTIVYDLDVQQGPVHQMAIGSYRESNDSLESSNVKEYETAGKLVVLATEAGQCIVSHYQKSLFRLAQTTITIYRASI
jgi:proteasomal ATPase-associated factor 1